MNGEMTDSGNVHDAPHSHRLFSAGAVFISTFIGSPLAGGVLVALNYARSGQRSRAAISIVTGLGAVFLFFAMAVSTSGDNPLPGLVYWLVLPPAVYLAARTLQGGLITAHRTFGGSFEPMWKAVTIALLVLSIVFPCAAVAESWIR